MIQINPCVRTWKAMGRGLQRRPEWREQQLGVFVLVLNSWSIFADRNDVYRMFVVDTRPQFQLLSWKRLLICLNLNVPGILSNAFSDRIKEPKHVCWMIVWFHLQNNPMSQVLVSSSVKWADKTQGGWAFARTTCLEMSARSPWVRASVIFLLTLHAGLWLKVSKNQVELQVCAE